MATLENVSVEDLRQMIVLTLPVAFAKKTNVVRTNRTCPFCLHSF